jgi:hypothetical protein
MQASIFPSNSVVTPTRIRWIFRILALGFGTAQTIAALDTINSDGRSYLEVARAYLRHDWAMAANSYWEPLYSWILAPFLAVLKPSLRHEYPLVHLINLGLFASIHCGVVLCGAVADRDHAGG